MHVFHDPTTGNAEIVLGDNTAPIHINGISRQRLVEHLWGHDVVLASTSHWQVIGGRHRHGLDPAPTTS